MRGRVFYRGVGPSAYADAVAKEYLSSGRDEGGRERLREEYIYKREGKGVMYEVREEAEGEEWAPHDGRVYAAAKERAGWWIQRREIGRLRGTGRKSVILDESRVGRREVGGNGEYWSAVLRGTGGHTGGRVASEEGEKSPGEHREEAKRGNERWGVGMSMRNGGELPHVTHGRTWEAERAAEMEKGEHGKACRRGQQGCPGCCGRKQWWRWERREDGQGSEWMRARGEQARWADTWHIIEGECGGVGAAKTEVTEIRRIIGAMRWILCREEKSEGRGKRKSRARKQPKPGMEGVVRVLDGAAALLTRGWKTEGEREERRGDMRHLIAGALPRPEEEERGEVQKMAKAVVARVKEIQAAVARLLAGWEEAGSKERRAREKEEGEREKKKATFRALIAGLRAKGRAKEERARVEVGVLRGEAETVGGEADVWGGGGRAEVRALREAASKAGAGIQGTREWGAGGGTEGGGGREEGGGEEEGGEGELEWQLELEERYRAEEERQEEEGGGAAEEGPEEEEVGEEGI